MLHNLEATDEILVSEKLSLDDESFVIIVDELEPVVVDALVEQPQRAQQLAEDLDDEVLDETVVMLRDMLVVMVELENFDIDEVVDDEFEQTLAVPLHYEQTDDETVEHI